MFDIQHQRTGSRLTWVYHYDNMQIRDPAYLSTSCQPKPREKGKTVTFSFFSLPQSLVIWELSEKIYLPLAKKIKLARIWFMYLSGWQQVKTHLQYVHWAESFLSFLINSTTLACLQLLQNPAARFLTGTNLRGHITPVLAGLHWLPVRPSINVCL